MIQSPFRDWHLAMRGLRRAPQFAITATVSIVIGVFLATQAATILRAGFRPALPYRDPAQLVQFDEEGVFPADIWSKPRVSRQLLRALQQIRGVAGVAEYAFSPTVVPGDKRATVDAYIVAQGLFQLLGVRPAIGRDFVELESHPVDVGAIILSYAYWQSRFDGDSSVIGRYITLRRGGKSAAHAIVGVMPAGFDFPPRAGTAFYIAAGSSLADTTKPWTTAVARLNAGESIRAIEAAANRVAVRHVTADAASTQEYFHGKVFRTSGRPGVTLTRYRIEASPDKSLEYLAFLLALGTLFVLVLAATNVASVLLIRGVSKYDEFAVRRALGATARDLAFPVLVESLLVAGSGCVIGLSAEVMYGRMLVRHFAGNMLFGRATAPIAVSVVVATLVVTMLFALLPMTRTTRIAPAAILRSAVHTEPGSRNTVKILDRLLAMSAALTVVIMVSAAQVAITVIGRLTHDPGYRTNRLYVQNVAGQGLNGGELPALQARVGGLGGVQGVAFGPPPSQAPLHSLEARASNRPRVSLGYGTVAAVSSSYFGLLQIPIVLGTGFGLDMSASSAAHVVVIGKSLAERLWPHESPIGRSFELYIDRDSLPEQLEIIGVAGNVNGVIRTDSRANAQVYVPLRTGPEVTTSMIVDPGLEPNLPQLFSAEREGFFGLRVEHGTWMSELVSTAASPGRLLSVCIVTFASGAVALTIVALVGLITFVGRLRRREFAVRLALGAPPGLVARAIATRGVSPVLVGAAIGAGFAPLGFAELRGRVFGLDAPSLAADIVGPILIAAVGLAAALLAGRSASRVDPASALR